MILPDTSVWVAHFKGMDVAAALPALLERDEVVSHRWILGELALGGLSGADRALFEGLDHLGEVDADEMLVLVDHAKLVGRGVGWVDVQLLAACRIAGCALWTRDRRLSVVAGELSLGWSPPP